jgi:hypothetical protein
LAGAFFAVLPVLPAAFAMPDAAFAALPLRARVDFTAAAARV